jgi:hypothetical protein
VVKHLTRAASFFAFHGEEAAMVAVALERNCQESGDPTRLDHEIEGSVGGLPWFRHELSFHVGLVWK